MKRRWLIAVPASVLLLLAATYVLVWFSMRQTVHALLDQLIASGQFERAEYRALWLSPLANVELSGLHLGKPDVDFIIDHARLKGVDWFNHNPRQLTVELDNIRFPSGLQTVAAMNVAFLPGLVELMTNDNLLPVHASLSFRHEPGIDEQIVFAGNITVPGYFILQSKGEVRHLPPEALTGLLWAEPAQAASERNRLLAQTSIHSMEWVLHDTGIVDAKLKAATVSSGTNPEDLRALLVSELGNYYQLMPANLQAVSKPVLGELAHFMQGGRTLTIAIAPTFDGSYQGLQQELMGVVVSGNYEKAVDLLQLKITTQ